MSLSWCILPNVLRCSAQGLSHNINRVDSRLKRSHFATIFLPSRGFHSGSPRCDRSFTNILADNNPPAVQVGSITNAGIQLADGLLIPSACVFLNGSVFLWDVPESLWSGWKEEHFEIFEAVVPKPEILLLGTGNKLSQAPAFLRRYLNQLGIQLDVMDTRNACSTYNILAEEGRQMAAALLPSSSRTWQKTKLR